MEDRKPVADIFELHIVRYDVALDSRGEFFTHFRIGIEHERIGIRGNENIRVQFSFGVQD